MKEGKSFIDVILMVVKLCLWLILMIFLVFILGVVLLMFVSGVSDSM